MALAAAVALPVLARPVLRERLLDAPEFAAAARSLPGGVGALALALYGCDYQAVLPALAAAERAMRRSWVLAPHARFIAAEVQLRAYTQVLQCHRTVRLDAMARAFGGVSQELLDADLSAFIALGRLDCKIDRVAGTVEPARADSHNTAYNTALHDGDALLNRLQKLARLVV